MKKIRQYKLFLALFALAAVTGCKKMIEIDPPVNTISTEQVFQTNEVANSALASIYIQMISFQGAMMFSNGGLSVYAGMSADEIVSFSGADNELAYQFETSSVDLSNTLPLRVLWQPAYNFIYGCNAVIEGIAASTSPQLTDSVRKVLTGEALFVRAFSYFYLTNFFGDVPMVLSTDYKTTSVMKKTTQAEIYEQIIEDLQEAREMLSGDYSVGGGERVRPNKWAAAALLARVQLYRGNWQAAEIQASDVIETSLYTLPGDLKSVFLKNSTEAIWQLRQDPIGSPPFNATFDGANFIAITRMSIQSASSQAIFLQPTYFNLLGGSLIPLYRFTPQMSKIFETGDKRKTDWVDSTRTPSVAPYNSAPYYHPYKYTQKKGTTGGAVTQYFMVLRLAEQYLIRAESRAQQDNLSGAAADLNKIRSRAGLPDIIVSTKDAMLSAIAKERQTELFAEWGHRWLDLKRTGQANTVLGAIAVKQPWKPYQLLYPIPSTEISANPAITQNPGYNQIQ